MLSNVFYCILAYTDGIAHTSADATLMHSRRYLCGVGAQTSGLNRVLSFSSSWAGAAFFFVTVTFLPFWQPRSEHLGRP